VNLRSSAVSHLSATLVRALAAAKPVVTSEGRGWEFVPEAARCLIPAGPDEVPALTAELKRLATDPERRRRMGPASRSYFEREATVGRMAERYLEVIEEVRARTRQAGART
jgi:glycosyltransferase involved in cell wall biosynthesis